MDLPTIWFILVGVLFTGYVMLDGFDLGVGGLHLFVRKDEDRRIFLNAIGPVWDGNEVWLVTGGGALFAAFPEVYATVFSGFYDAFMLLLFGLIFRAVAIEFRSKQPGRLWRGGWDTAFAIGSLLSSLLIGVAMGNVIHGVPLNENHEFMGTILTLLNPYSLMVGVFTVSLFLMHGNIYLILKTEGELQQRLLRWVKVTIPIFLVLFAIVGFSTPALLPHIGEALARKPIPLILFFVLAILLALNIPREVYRGKEFRAFLCSCGTMASLMILFGATVYPNMVFSVPDPANSLTIANGSSTDKTLGFMFVVALIGVPIVIAYMASIYYIFRGKVKLDAESY